MSTSHTPIRPLVCALAGLAMLLLGCGDQPNDPQGVSARPDSGAVGASASDGRLDWPETIRVGLVPTEGAADIQERFRPLRQHLADRLGIDVELQSATSYNGVITAMENDQIEFAYFGPKSYVEAARRANAEALLLELDSDGEPGYYGILIVHAESDIQSMNDTKGRTFAFTEPNSTSGFLVPSVVLAEEFSIDPVTHFAEVQFSGGHGTSILQVVNREVDVAATNDLEMDRLIEKGSLQRSDYREIHRSALIPGSPMVARGELPQSLKDAFIDAMLEVNDMPELKQRFQNGGYERTTDAQYDVIRLLIDTRTRSQSGG